ncbi:hypothetical protein ACAG26_14815 [Mycobacterium sp. pUA109]|uniref:hypothetical protein n=1 Tax=Mycobacterium sp. pUA109 TaxID=3238982 RepID=UPI00351B4CBE
MTFVFVGVRRLKRLTPQQPRHEVSNRRHPGAAPIHRCHKVFELARERRCGGSEQSVEQRRLLRPLQPVPARPATLGNPENADWQTRIVLTDRMGKNSRSTIGVGSRVRTADSPPKAGTVIEDFGDAAGQLVVIDRERTAQSRRWAVALDDGSLVFLDDDALTAVD